MRDTDARDCLIGVSFRPFVGSSEIPPNHASASEPPPYALVATTMTFASRAFKGKTAYFLSISGSKATNMSLRGPLTTIGEKISPYSAPIRLTWT